MRGDRVAAVILLGGLLSGTTSARATLAPPPPDVSARVSLAIPTPSLAVVSEDPYTNATSYHRTEVEPDSFAFGSTIVATFQAGRFQDRGASNLGWSVSMDAGGTWTGGFLPSTTIRATPSGTWRRVIDPAVAYDAAHDTWLIIGLGARSVIPIKFGLPLHYTVFVSRSTDGAQSFGEPVIVRESNQREYFDKTWIACDNTPTSPFYGHCYAQWDDNAHHNRLWMSTSTDGGLTWHQAAIRKDIWVQGGQPLVQPNGTVVMPIPQSPNRIDSFISTDGGLSYSGHGDDYSGPLEVRDVKASEVQGKLRVSIDPPLISADVDASGNVYVVWSDCRFRDFGPHQQCTQNDIVMSTTVDGRHWSPVVRIPIDARTSSVDHFLPAIAVDPSTSGSSAHVAIVYYFYPDADCSPSTCELSVGFVSSTDGGSTWTPQQLAGPFKTKWLPLTESGYMVGDYISVSFVGGQASPVFTIGTEGTCELGDITSCNVWTASATIPLVPAS
jgi:hypothetical protein